MTRLVEELRGDPTHCPYCRSQAITTNPQKHAAAAYWRCETCGQLWHPDRLRATILGDRDRR
jgi:transposase-like protein